MQQQNKYVIIVAGGTGSRMNNAVPKQFMMLNQKPTIVYTIEAFLKYQKNISLIVSIHKDYQIDLQKLFAKYFKNQPFKLVIGGKTRYHSVKNALATLKNKTGIVAIHDAARPCVSIETIKCCFDTAQQKGNAVPCVPISESLRHVQKNTNKFVARAAFRIVQTPQCFDIQKLQQAYKTPYNKEFTDDSTVFEYHKHKINLVLGNYENIKITQEADLPIAQFYLKKRKLKFKQLT